MSRPYQSPFALTRDRDTETFIYGKNKVRQPNKGYLNFLVLSLND